jgi:hypothetical protein
MIVSSQYCAIESDVELTDCYTPPFILIVDYLPCENLHNCHLCLNTLQRVAFCMHSISKLVYIEGSVHSSSFGEMLALLSISDAEPHRTV